MAGGEYEEESMLELLAQVAAEQGLPPNLDTPASPYMPQPPSTTDQGALYGGPSHSFQVQPTVANMGPLADVFAKILETQQTMLGQVMANQGTAGREDKKRKADDTDHKPQQSVIFQTESLKIKDDAHTFIEFELRQSLRPINADPKDYWDKGTFKACERPILGAAVFLEHLMPGGINEGTICKSHDRNAYTKLDNFLMKNSGVADKNKKKIQVQEVGEDQYAMGVETRWEQATTVWEVVDGIMNFMALEHMIRQYSYTGLAMLRALHNMKYFCGMATSPKHQRVLIESWFNECLKKNKERARVGKYPVTYRDAIKIANDVLAANQVTSFTNFYKGDPYIGSREEDLKKKNREIEELKREVKALKAELSKKSGNSYRSRNDAQNSSYSASDYSNRTAEEKKKMTCRDWNSPAGCNREGRDRNHCGFGENALRHGCSKVTGEKTLCWRNNHKEAEHR